MSQSDSDPNAHFTRALILFGSPLNRTWHVLAYISGSRQLFVVVYLLLMIPGVMDVVIEIGIISKSK